MMALPHIIIKEKEQDDKIGILSTMPTTEKTSLAGAISEVKNQITSHSAENANKAHGGVKKALVRLTVEQSIPNLTLTEVVWNSPIHANSEIWSLSSPTRLVVPIGATRVRLIANTRWGLSPEGERVVRIHKGGSMFGGAPFSRKHGSNGRCETTLVSPILNVNGGDYFELALYQSSGGAIGFGGVPNECWFGMEVIE